MQDFATAADQASGDDESDYALGAAHAERTLKELRAKGERLDLVAVVQTIVNRGGKLGAFERGFLESLEALL